MTALAVRRAVANDASAINAVYNPYIRDTVITFETVEHTLEQRGAWLAEKAGNPRYPVLVAESGGRVVGFANAAPFDPRGAYETSVKVSVFVEQGRHRAGVGRALYAVLFDILPEADAHRAYALITAPNPASVALHERFGFRHVSTLSEVGRKFGRYCDVMWFEKRL